MPARLPVRHMNTQGEIVQTHALSKNYAKQIAVSELNLDVKAGEIFGLLGPNGAGKSTTIGMLAGIIAPSSGDIMLAGKRFLGTPQQKRLLGVVPQELAIYPKLSGRENLAFFGKLYGIRHQELARRIDEMLALVGLTERADSLVEQYSGGMKRRLNLAAGLMHRPELLLLDEPTVGVDPQSRNHIFEGVKELNRQGLTVIYTSHYMEEVESLCSRAGIMDGGRLAACDTVENLIQSMGGSVVEITAPAAGVGDTLVAALRQGECVDAVSVVEADGAVGSDSRNSILRIKTPNPDGILAGIMSVMNEQHVHVSGIAIKRPSLEDVFLSLTGKNLRD